MKKIITLISMMCMLGSINAVQPDLTWEEFKLTGGMEEDSLQTFVQDARIFGASSIFLRPCDIKNLIVPPLFKKAANKHPRKFDAYGDASENIQNLIKSDLNSHSCLMRGPSRNDEERPRKSCPSALEPIKIQKEFEKYEQRSKRIKDDVATILTNYESCTVDRSWGQSFLGLFGKSECDINRKNAFKGLASWVNMQREISQKNLEAYYVKFNAKHNKKNR